MKHLHIITVVVAFCAGLAANACQDEMTGAKPAVCGNSIVEQEESCDDGNVLAQDGCTQLCAVEDGWVCPEPGVACERIDPGKKCGNRVIDTEEFEDCDDGNAIAGDGCSELCLTETNWECPIPGNPCISLNSCGNSVTEGAETCDDANTDSGDGCSSSCTIEEGWRCLYDGAPCAPIQCGDAIVDSDLGEICDEGIFNSDEPYGDHCMKNCQKSASCGDAKVDAGYELCDDGTNAGGYNQCKPDCSALDRFCGDAKRTDYEACDDGNARSGDGCDAKCTVEDGWRCPLNAPCVQILCGNKTLDPGEQCDDANSQSGDGCSAFCRLEPGFVCPKAGSPCSKIPCGNGQIVDGDGKQCDDANTTPGDGCDAFCRIETGWICSEAGKPCYARSCGDGIIAAGEICDDGNNKAGDGCSERCQIETGYHCATPGLPCVKGRCGDGIIDGGESCDTGSANSAGCAQCQLQPGWKCEVPGTACTQIICGDSKIEGLEQCDDGNKNAGDGCSNSCQIEASWHCPAPGKACIKGKCGDKILDGAEQCDDGNLQAGDGCSPLCETEPIYSCQDGVCKPVCGDGITMWEVGEQCDDGNLQSGDGCDAQCKIETGFSCTDFKGPAPKTLNLPIVYRDFVRYNNKSVSTPTDGYLTQAIYNALPADCKGNNGYRQEYFPEVNRPSPDFYSYCPASNCLGAVLPDLDSDGTPALAPSANIVRAPGMAEGITCRYLYTCPTMFKWWFKDVPGINVTIPSTLVLTQSTSDPSSYAYQNAAFYPINGGGYGPAGSNGNVNGEFTSEFQSYFKYKGGETLTFNGDDDVWVFFNNKLAVDVGGIHPAWEKSITLDTASAASNFKMFPGGIYAIKMFHAERCTGGSSFRLTLAGFLNMGTATCSAICGDGLLRGTEQCDAGADNGKPESGCTATCTIKAYCGNAKIEYPEACDDGPDNGKPNKCPANCVYANCNNQHIDPGEECDPTVPSSIPAGKYCLNTCRFSRCGDNYIDSRIKEECDDGNTDNSDMCTSQCKAPYCGDGIVSAHFGEVCDDGKNDGSYNGCGFGCAYLPPRCGDAIVDTSNGEECDDSINDGAYGACRPDCKLASRCGDGVVDPQYEDCDDANNTDNDGCTNTCRIRVN